MTTDVAEADPPTSRTLTRPRPHLEVDWSILSPQGRVLFYVALCPHCSVQEIAIALDLTERAVWGLVRDLRRENMVILQKEGRRHRYRVNLDAPLLHPTIEGFTLRPMLARIVARSDAEPNENCVRLGDDEDSRQLLS